MNDPEAAAPAYYQEIRTRFEILREQFETNKQRLGELLPRLPPPDRLTDPFDHLLRFSGSLPLESVPAALNSADGAGGILAVIGQVGAGKSTVLAEIAEQFADTDMTVVRFEDAMMAGKTIDAYPAAPTPSGKMVDPGHFSGIFTEQDYLYSSLIFRKAVQVAAQRHRYVLAEVMATTPPRGLRALKDLSGDTTALAVIAVAAGFDQLQYGRLHRTRPAHTNPLPSTAGGTWMGSKRADSELNAFLSGMYRQYRPEVFTVLDLRLRILLGKFYPWLLSTYLNIPPERSLIVENVQTPAVSRRVPRTRVQESSFLPRLPREEITAWFY